MVGGAFVTGFLFYNIMVYSLYVLVKNSRPIYVGITSNVLKRKMQHQKTKDFEKMIVLKKYENKKDALIAENAIVRLNGIFDIGLLNGKYACDTFKKNFYVDYNILSDARN